MEKVFLHHGDCLEVMKTIPDGSVDMILCDLPYGTTQCKWDVVIPFDQLWEQYERIIKENGAIVLFGSEPFSSHLRLSKMDLFRYDWIWNKKSITGHLDARKRPLKQHEILSVFYKNQPNYNPIMHTKKLPRDRRGFTEKKANTEVYNDVGIYVRTTDPNQSFPRSIIEINAVVGNAKEKVPHPTQKPIALLEYLIKTYTNEGEVVLDNTMGSGSTGVAAVNTNRRFIGIEKEAKYFEIAQKRIAEVKSS